MDIIVRGIRSGLPLGDCMRMIANEAAEPRPDGIPHRSWKAHAMGMPIGEAVAKLYERVPVPEANFFGIVISIQQKSGGNLSEALGNLSKVIRDRKTMRGKISAMSMEAKASAAIIGSCPSSWARSSTSRAPTTSSCSGPRRAAASGWHGGICMMVMRHLRHEAR